MNRGLPKFRSYQLTIPNMMRLREEQTQMFHSPLRATTSIMDNGGVLYQPPNTPSGSRINPYKVPFQRRQTIEPVYADTAPVIMPQLSSAFGLGGMLAGNNEIYIPNIRQHAIESPALQMPTGIKDDTDLYLTGLTSSPPNHFVHEEIMSSVKKVEANHVQKKNDMINDRKIERINTPEVKMIVEPANTAMRVLTGSVEKILKWEKMWETKKDKTPVLFEVVAPLLQIKEGSKPNEYQLLLRESEGPVLTVMYYEIDRVIPNLNRGQNVRCVCRSLGKKRFQAFSVRPASQQEHSSLQRLSFLCQRAAQEALLDSPKI